jgi:DNA-nicking Smr family endonuclease
MAQLKKQMKKGGGGGKDEPPPLNSPFREARKELLALIAPSTKPAPAPAKPAPATRTQGEERLSDEELFRREMSGVHRGAGPAKSPGGRGRELPIEQTREAQIRQSEDAEAYAQLSDLVDGTGTFDISDTDEYIEGIALGLDRRLLSRLRRGDFSIQAHVDLHGLTRDEARIRVEGFLHESRLRSRRCVLIIHGRGLNSKDQIPVLKESVRIWLTRGRISRSVLAFATARPTDGGAGAVYVLLRR